MRDAREHLHYLALEAARGAEGSIAGAEAALDQSIRDHNSVELERELCSAYRGAALLSYVQRAFEELRLSAHHDPIPDPEELRALNGKQPRAQLRKPALVSLLDEFYVNGQRIGDLTPEELEPAAKARERDARFIRLLIVGIPPGARVREHKNADDAKVCYALASSPVEPEPEPPTPVRASHRRRRTIRERQHPPRQAKTGRTRRGYRQEAGPRSRDSPVAMCGRIGAARRRTSASPALRGDIESCVWNVLTNVRPANRCIHPRSRGQLSHPRSEILADYSNVALRSIMLHLSMA